MGGFCASAPRNVCLRVLRIGHEAGLQQLFFFENVNLLFLSVSNIEELVRLYEWALHGYFSQISNSVGDSAMSHAVDVIHFHF